MAELGETRGDNRGDLGDVVGDSLLAWALDCVAEGASETTPEELRFRSNAGVVRDLIVANIRERKEETT